MMLSHKFLALRLSRPLSIWVNGCDIQDYAALKLVVTQLEKGADAEIKRLRRSDDVRLQRCGI